MSGVFVIVVIVGIWQIYLAYRDENLIGGLWHNLGIVCLLGLVILSIIGSAL